MASYWYQYNYNTNSTLVCMCQCTVVKWHWNCFSYEVGRLLSVMLQIFEDKQENKPTIKNNEDKGTRSDLCLNFGFIERL